MAAYRRVDDLTVTCRLTACTPGSAPGPTLGIEYGKPYLTLGTDQEGFVGARDRVWGRRIPSHRGPSPEIMKFSLEMACFSA